MGACLSGGQTKPYGEARRRCADTGALVDRLICCSFLLAGQQQYGQQGFAQQGYPQQGIPQRHTHFDSFFLHASAHAVRVINLQVATLGKVGATLSKVKLTGPHKMAMTAAVPAAVCWSCSVSPVRCQAVAAAGSGA